jgi:hypothetical protein
MRAKADFFILFHVMLRLMKRGIRNSLKGTLEEIILCLVVALFLWFIHVMFSSMPHYFHPTTNWTP